ncbi:MAG: hypothetical protein J6Z09_02735, partial [Lachnospiraceae bacterium]|nr:hypothetical protein [Lachnospiraceae bacterium]
MKKNGIKACLIAALLMAVLSFPACGGSSDSSGNYKYSEPEMAYESAAYDSYSDDYDYTGEVYAEEAKVTADANTSVEV